MIGIDTGFFMIPEKVATRAMEVFGSEARATAANQRNRHSWRRAECSSLNARINSSIHDPNSIEH